MSADVFDIYGGRVQPSPESATEEYRAALPFLADENRFDIMAHMSNGDIRLVSYGYKVEIISVSPEHLDFIYTNGVLALKGENLRALLPMLQHHEVKSLHPFDATRHADPAEGEPIIRQLRWMYVEEALAEAAAARQALPGA